MAVLKALVFNRSNILTMGGIILITNTFRGDNYVRGTIKTLVGDRGRSLETLMYWYVSMAIAFYPRNQILYVSYLVGG